MHFTYGSEINADTVKQNDEFWKARIISEFGETAASRATPGKHQEYHQIFTIEARYNALLNLPWYVRFTNQLQTGQNYQKFERWMKAKDADKLRSLSKMIAVYNDWYRESGSNRYGLSPLDFESNVSTSSGIPAQNSSISATKNK